MAVDAEASQEQPEDQSERYRRLPTGTHGLDPELVKRDQRERLQGALIELIEQKGYQAVRIIDLARLARVSQPTFYSLYKDKEDLLIATYDEISAMIASTILAAYGREGSKGARLGVAVQTFAELAAAEPQAVSLFVLGAFGAGANMLGHRRRTLDQLEERIRASRDGGAPKQDPDLTVRFILGGIREVTASRLREGRASELPALAEQLTAWASAYPARLAAELEWPPAGARGGAPRPDGVVGEAASLASERARRAEGRLPSGRSDMPRQMIMKSQRERIVDATAAIVAEKGLAKLTIPEIAKRANVSHQTFYEMYPSKHDAFLGAQKVGLHQALQVTIETYEARKDDWPSAVAAGFCALIDYLSSEPAHAHLTVVDTFAASPEAIEIRDTAMQAFAAFLGPGYELAPEVPPVAAEAIAGGVWQVLHHYIANDRLVELPEVIPQGISLALTPFLGPKQAVATALAEAQRRAEDSA
jgi:AcrR family transcriptional regulator